MSVIGYARVSTGLQNVEGQEDALRAAGCERVFVDHVSGATKDRPELRAALDYLRSGDTLVVWRLDRLGRSLAHLIEIMQDLGARGVEFRSLSEAIDTSSPTGRLLFHIAGAFAQFERDLVRERTGIGLAAARAQGRRGGRPSVISPQMLTQAKLLRAGGQTYHQIATALGVSQSAVGRALKDYQPRTAKAGG